MSVLRQSLEAINLVVLDDSRDDLTRAVIENFARDDSRVQYYKNSPPKGIVGNWNACVDHCSSEFLLILHHDDLLCKNTLREYKRFLELHPDCGFVHSDVIDVDVFSGKRQRRRTQEKEIIPSGNEAIRKILLDNSIACSTVAVRKACYEQHGNFLEEFWVSPDWEMWARLSRFYSIGHLDDIGAIVVIDGKNTHLSGIPPEEFLQQQRGYVKRILGYVEGDKKTQDALNALVELMLVKMMARYYILFIRAGRFGVAWMYLNFLRTKVRLGTVLALTMNGLLRYVHSSARWARNQKNNDYGHLYKELL